ncbi:hypothetical protein [Symmachiella dynata]|uniref:Uncharacterized protein n=1 Tax=Symmachiella dynata TaxID=2527995 RepID=A0A517ZNA9_9PLAN|nr:hypothetical protein [Symmachiella dynata]QDT48346.1 hypothetical protein Pan258_23880 [Symmachiella dynata]QDU43938.1 hypothetical protein Mal52_24160 [Symmachiella dynata]
MPEDQNLEMDFEEIEGEEEYEEISGEEVDRVVESLEQLIASVDSENVKAYLDDALNNIYYLIHDEDEEMDDAEIEADAQIDDELDDTFSEAA